MHLAIVVDAQFTFPRLRKFNIEEEKESYCDNLSVKYPSHTPLCTGCDGYAGSRSTTIREVNNLF